MEGISNIHRKVSCGEQGMSNLEGQKGENGYQVNRKSGCRIPGIRISGHWFEKSHHT